MFFFVLFSLVYFSQLRNSISMSFFPNGGLSPPRIRRPDRARVIVLSCIFFTWYAPPPPFTCILLTDLFRDAGAGGELPLSQTVSSGPLVLFQDRQVQPVVQPCLALYQGGACLPKTQTACRRRFGERKPMVVVCCCVAPLSCFVRETVVFVRCMMRVLLPCTACVAL